MAQLIEAQGNAFFAKCKGAAVIITALTGLTLGVLNWFKDTRDPRVKVGYQELAKQVENLSGDVQKLATSIKTQGEEIAAVQNWIIVERDKRTAVPSPAVAKIMKTVKARKPEPPMPPPRKPASWEHLQQHLQQVQGN